MTSFWLAVAASCLVTGSLIAQPQDAAFWREAGGRELRRMLELERNTNIARNVILMIGDGMGLSTVMAARVYKGQLQNKTGEETELVFERFPHLALSKVYTTNKQVPDSAASATAMMSGVKTKSRLLGVDDTVQVGDCRNISSANVTSILDWSKQKGKAVGIVTTTRITHATPAAAFAHTANRDWESDSSIPTDVKGCTAIARQLIEDNSDIEVILGGGSKHFTPVQNDGIDLIAKWKKNKEKRKKAHSFVWNKGQFDDVQGNQTDYLLGLFADDHMAFELDRDDSRHGEPSLADMTTKAIQVLQRSDKGFFLMVEGGRIDHAHHINNAKRAIVDTLAFEKAVEVAVRMTEESDTLIIVTADHSHVMTVAGYPERGNDILGLVRPMSSENMGGDGLPYTTLSYANGPSYTAGRRRDLTKVDVAADGYQQAATVPMYYETHSGEDVAIYARGPMAHLLSGVKENNFIAFAMAHASCVGKTDIRCERGRTTSSAGNKKTIAACNLTAASKDDNNSNDGATLSSFSTIPCLILSLLYISTLV